MSPAAASQRRMLLAAPAMVVAVLGAVWALSAPLSSSPDEPEHVVRAVSLYSGSGVKVRLHVEGQAFYGTVSAPQYYVRSFPRQSCVVADATRPAACKSSPSRDPGRIISGNTSAAGHPPLYYLLVGWVGRLLPSDTGVLLMRLVSTLLCAGLVLLGTVVLSRRTRTMYPALVALTAVSPVAAFLAGAVNPQAFEICLTFATFALVWDLFCRLAGRDAGQPTGGSSRRTERAAYLAVLAASVALGLTRPLSALFLTVAVGAAVILSGLGVRRLGRPRGLLALSVGLAGVPVAVAFELWAGHSSVDLVPAQVPSTFSGIQSLLALVGNVAVQAGGVVSSLEAGPSSLAVAGFLVAVLSSLLVAALIGERPGVGVSIAIMVATLVLPIVVNVPNVLTLNVVIWQGRYGLPMLLLSLVAAGLAVAGLDCRRERRVRRRALGIVCGAMAVAHFGGYWFAMYRWSVGVGGPMWWPSDAGWAPPVPWWLLLASMIATCLAYGFGLPEAAARFEVRTSPNPDDP